MRASKLTKAFHRAGLLICATLAVLISPLWILTEYTHFFEGAEQQSAASRDIHWISLGILLILAAIYIFIRGIGWVAASFAED